jgi:hypothetical protein
LVVNRHPIGRKLYPKPKIAEAFKNSLLLIVVHPYSEIT